MARHIKERTGLSNLCLTGGVAQNWVLGGHLRREGIFEQVHTGFAPGDEGTALGDDDLDEEALQAVADTTGGRYFFAQDRDQLAEIYDELDRLGTRDVEAETYRPRIDRRELRYLR